MLALEHYWVSGGGRPALLVHATGFCKEVWRPVVAELDALGVGAALTSVDQRGHGGSTAAGRGIDWVDLGHDVVRVAAGRTGLIGVGHSSGGAALVLAELAAPGTFDRLVLIEPVIPPPPFRREERHPLSIAAAKRTRHFADREAAATNYRGRGPFTGWDERALWAYVAGGFVAVEGGGVQLACDPDLEAEFYRGAGAHGAFARLGELRLPVTVVAGAGTDFPPGFFAQIADQIPAAELDWVADAGHFVPMERPGRTAAIIASALGAGPPN